MESALKLRDRILGFGGEQACMLYKDIDTPRLLRRGQLWYADRVEFMRGEPSQCHRNSCDLWINNRDRAIICTGYALSADGMWRAHSWLVHLRCNKSYIVETTEPRVAYYGYAMNVNEAEQFCMEN